MALSKESINSLWKNQENRIPRLLPRTHGNEPLFRFVAAHLGINQEHISEVYIDTSHQSCSDYCCQHEVTELCVVTSDEKQTQIGLDLFGGLTGLICLVAVFDRTGEERYFDERMQDPEYAEVYSNVRDSAVSTFQNEIEQARIARHKAIERADKAEFIVGRLKAKIEQTRLASGKAFDALIELETEFNNGVYEETK